MNIRQCLSIYFALILSTPGSSHSDSSFNEVRSVVFGAQPVPTNDTERKEQRVYKQNKLPQYTVGINYFYHDSKDFLYIDSVRTLSDSSDYLPRIEKLVHSNGICFSGTWEIFKDTVYTGYFRKGAKGLIIARASTALSETKKEEPRAFGFAGKIYPTGNPDLVTPTANFFVVDVLAGTQRNHYVDVKMTNKPELGFRFSVLYLALQAGIAFSNADRNPSFRPLYPVSELGLPQGNTPKTPLYMMIKAKDNTPVNDSRDFRDELSIKKPEGPPLVFEIMVSSSSANKNSRNWNSIGDITLTESIVSYGCDRRLHFSHPKIRDQDLQ